MSRKYLVGAFSLDRGNIAKDGRIARRESLATLLSNPGCEIEHVQELVDAIMSDNDDKKRLNYSFAVSDERATRAIDHPLNQAACMGNVLVVKYFLDNLEHFKIELNCKKLTGHNQTYPDVLSAVARTIKEELAKDSRDVQKLLNLEEVLLLLLSNQQAVDQTLSLSATPIAGMDTFSLTFTMMLGKAEDLFKTQDILGLQLLGTMTRVSVRSRPPVAADLQDGMRAMLDRPPSANKKPKYWLTYLYESVAGTDLNKLKPEFLRTLMQIGYKTSMMDVGFFNLLKSEILTGGAQAEVSKLLMVSLLEGVLCCHTQNSADCSIPYLLEQEKVLPYLLDYCKKHYIDDSEAWKDHLPIIHYLIATLNARNILNDIVTNFDHIDLYQQLKAWALMSKSLEKEPFSSFSALLDTVEAGMKRSDIFILENITPLVVEEDTKEACSPYQTLKKFTKEQIANSNTLKNQLVRGLNPATGSPQLRSKLAVKSAEALPFSAGTMQSKEQGARALATAIAAASEIEPGSDRGRKDSQGKKDANLSTDDPSELYAPVANRPKEAEKFLGPIYGLPEDSANMYHPLEVQTLEELVEGCVKSSDKPVAEETTTVQPVVAKKPSVAAKPVVAAKPAVLPGKQPSTQGQPSLTAEELAAKSQTVKKLKQDQEAQQKELERLKALLAAEKAKAQQAAPTPVSSEDLPPPPPEFFEPAAASASRSSSPALFSASARRQSSGSQPPLGELQEIRSKLKPVVIKEISGAPSQSFT